MEAKKYVSYVSENVQLYGMFTARQNLRFFAELGGKKGLKNHELDDAMRTVGLPEKALTMRLKNFSKGMLCTPGTRARACRTSWPPAGP